MPLSTTRQVTWVLRARVTAKGLVRGDHVGGERLHVRGPEVLLTGDGSWAVGAIHESPSIRGRQRRDTK